MPLQKPTKVVFPVAGLGTRFLPATKATPKEMLPIVDKPLIQYAVEEAIEAGFKEIIFVTSSTKRAIEDHFDSNYELESVLTERQQDDLVQQIRDIMPADVSYIYVRQNQALGLGHAVLCAKHVIGNEPFAVVLADDLIKNKEQGCLKQMLRHYSSSHPNIVAVEKIDKNLSKQYGIIGTKEQQPQSIFEIETIIEKPEPSQAPSDLGVVGRYILDAKVFDHLNRLQQHAGAEIQLTDAIAGLMHDQTVHAFQFQGKRYDCGNKLGYLKATVEYALDRKDLAPEFRAYLKSVV